MHPPEYGHWRKAMLEDLAILTGGRVIARDLGGRIEDITREDLGGAARVKTTASHTAIIRGDGDPAAIAARRAQVQRLYENAPPNIEQDKLRERLAKLSGGTAVLYAGGVTPVEQKRTIQLIEDALQRRARGGRGRRGRRRRHGARPDRAERSSRSSPTPRRRRRRRRAARAGGAVAAALADRDQCRRRRRRDRRRGQRGCRQGDGYNAAVGQFEDMFEAGVIDPGARDLQRRSPTRPRSRR